ncbi:MAG TPA: hypothetical protein VG817_05375 [Gemmatimonadales bacterium]|nr:hypothetical protein [Gemmatimonadales bacterium]
MTFRSRHFHPAPRTLHAVLLLLTLVAGSAAAQSRDWSPDDRAVVGDYTEIRAVAASTERIFVITRNAVLVRSTLDRRWEGPYLPRDPGLLYDVVSAIADPLDQSVWLIRRSGYVHFDPVTRQFSPGLVPGSVTDAAIDRNAPASGLFLRSNGQWYQASRGGAALPSPAPQAPERPATVQEAIRDNPAIQANIAGLLVTSRLRPISYTSAARLTGFGGQGWILGTNTAGVVAFPLGSGFPEPIRYGLPNDLAMAVTVSNNQVWVVNGRTAGSDAAVSRMTRSLDSVAWFQGGRAIGLPFTSARSIVAEGSVLWLATDQGLLQVTPSDQPEIRDYQRELPDIPVLDLAAQGDRIGIGLAHGVALQDGERGLRRYAMNFAEPAAAVLPGGGDTLWIGTRVGLWFADSSMADVRRPSGYGDAPSQQDPVLDLAWRGDTLVALTASRLIWRDPASGSFTLGPSLGGNIGRLFRIVSGKEALYIAGTRGIGLIRLGGPILRSFRAPGDIPGEVTDLAVDKDYLWVASQGGLVRFRLDAIGR